MECNRDEAVRARDIAEQKYAKQDFLGAKKFVLKAQQLFPGLEGLTQMLPVMEVHSVAQCKLGAQNTETDWYGILQLEPSADDSTVKRQYRRLALLLHPDKNKAVGAEAAFKLISEAWGILSDKTKRAVHDMKRVVKVKVSHSRVGMEANMQSFQTPFNANPAPVPTPAPAPNPQSHSTGTFWTSCPGCGTQYQYLRTYENYQLQCRKCMVVFMARDIHGGTAANGAAGYSWASYEGHRQDYNFNKPPPTSGPFNGASAPNGFMNGSYPSSFPHQASNAAFFSSAAAAAASQSKVAAAAAAAAAASSAGPANNLAADVVQQTYQKVKRERVEAEKENKRKEKEMRRKEKEDQRKDKEEQRKIREAERAREAMDRLRAKRHENMTREEFKRKVDVRRKLKRKKRQTSEEDGEDLEDEDQKGGGEQQVMDDFFAPLPRRRSGRTKKNVATYKVDEISDDSELEEFPASKRAKSEVGADDTEKSEENGGEAGRHQAPSENGGKGKSIADDNINHEKRGSGGSGVNGRDEFDGHRSAATERNKGDQVGATNKDSSDSDILVTSRRFEGVARVSKLYEGGMHKAKSGKSSQQVESPSPEKGVECETNQEGKVFKSEDFRDEKSPSKSPRTLRMRVKSPKVPFHSGHSVDKEEDQKPQKRASPSPSAGSTFSGEKEDEKEDDEPDPDEEDEEHIDVPDPDFFDFDSLRTEKDILAGQIWAVYDDQDGMPRFYCRISRASTKPFKAHMCWLELSNTPDKSKLPWLEDSGLSVTCGEFKVGKSTIMAQINTFSHIMVEKAAGKGILKIYPKKDQVWAVFRDWDPEGRLGPIKVPKLNGEGTAYSYDMVVILNDFSEEKGVKAVKLVKYVGYKTLFHKSEGQDAVRFFKPADLQRFSHSVPVSKMDDLTADTCQIPRGALELDPASTPMDLILGPSGQSR